MYKEKLTPKSFIKNKEELEKYTCGICYEICIKPARCKGSCKQIYCLKCVSDLRQIHDRCPNRCSEPFLVAQIPAIQVQFYCPFNFADCLMEIKSLQAFSNHHLYCQYVSAEELQLKRLKRQYRCLKNHRLEFFVGTYEQMINSKCDECEESAVCRSKCRICDTFYCVSCRVPPCSKSSCPIGHNFKFMNIGNLSYICDICGISTSVGSDGVYDDPLCNFGICQICFELLPNELDKSKAQELMVNNPAQCACGKPLIDIDRINEKQICYLCAKQKQCPKYCPSCKKNYCLSCKIVFINNDDTCEHDHQFLKENESMKEEGIQHSGCMKCEAKAEQYFIDKTCGIRICNDCLEYLKKVSIDKERLNRVNCEKGHALTYISGRKDYYGVCYSCSEMTIHRLVCSYCPKDHQIYCFRCKPILLKSCYFGHPLKHATFNGIRECHFCLKQTNQFQYCKRCFFYVCLDCVSYNLQHFKQQKKQIENQLSSLSIEEQNQL